MKFIEFKKRLSDFIVFSLEDIRMIDPNFNVVQLSQWQKKGYLQKIIRGKYIFTDVELNEEKLFLVANELLSPSYVSLEMALSWHNFIPEGVYTVTSVSTIRPMEYQTEIGDFSYRKIKEGAFFGDELHNVKGSKRTYRIASPEKAVVDYLYYNHQIDSKEDVGGLRFNPETISSLNRKLVGRYAEDMENKKLLERVGVLFNYFGR